MSGPEVSVIIPAYNAAQFLRRAVESVRAQTYTAWEVLVVDDASSDDTGAVAEALQAELGDRMRYLRQARGGASVARNAGIAAARGRFLAFLDADDAFLPDKLARQLELFERQPQLGLVFSDFTTVDLAGRRQRCFADPNLRALAAPHEEVAPNLRVLTGDFFGFLLRQHFISPITAMVRRSVLGDTIRFPVGLDYWEERVFFLSVAQVTPAGYVNEPLAINHFVSGSLSRTDVMQNLAHRVRALEEIARRFDAVGPEVHTTIRQELRTCVRALALARYKRGDFTAAAGLFARCLRLQPSLRGMVHWCQAAVRAARTPGGDSAADSLRPIR
ncbi:MAG: glycosyltransferase family 2 protein [Phycisphaerales bacterium]|nr:glycosyltransferase family 2 protein [Phycisphaerales bacterium]